MKGDCKELTLTEAAGIESVVDRKESEGRASKEFLDIRGAG